MGLFTRRKNKVTTLAGAGGSDAVVRHRDTGLVVMNVDSTIEMAGRGTVTSGLLQTEVAAGQWVVLERGGARSSMRVAALEAGDRSGQTLDHAAAGTQIGLLLEPAPTVLGELGDAVI